MILLYALVAGLLAGLATGGRLSALVDLHIRWWPIAVGGLVFQLLLFSPPAAATVGDAGPPLYVLSTAVVLIALIVNLRLPGFWLIALGAVLNLTAIVANGGFMPASPEALAALHGVSAVPTDAYSNSVVAGPSTNLALLGDIFVLPRPLPLANVFSIGDVLIGLGGALFVVQTMRRSGPGLPAQAGLESAAD
jgi:hypothetical protein